MTSKLKSLVADEKKVLLLGATGLLGHVLLRTLCDSGIVAFGTYRKHQDFEMFSAKVQSRLIGVSDLLDSQELSALLEEFKPNVVINCLSVDSPINRDLEDLLQIYSLLPKFLHQLCTRINARYIHISSDGVFSGQKGNYSEADNTDATDKYGISKILGETDSVGSVTIRTSIVGPSLRGSSGLIDWFFKQSESCYGYSNYFFSGITTFELSRIIAELILPNQDISGTYHIGGQRISKLKLLQLLRDVTQKDIKILEQSKPLCDRSLNCEKFRVKTSYIAPPLG